jgi:hypothetical protein
MARLERSIRKIKQTRVLETGSIRQIVDNIDLRQVPDYSTLSAISRPAAIRTTVRGMKRYGSSRSLLGSKLFRSTGGTKGHFPTLDFGADNHAYMDY